MYGVCTKILIFAAISPGAIPINNQINANASTQSSTGNRNDVSFQPCTKSHPARESCVCFPGASPVLSVSHLSDAGAARGSGCVLDQPPTRRRAALGCSILRSVQRLGMVHWTEGCQGVRHPARSPSPGSKAPTQLLSSCSPGAPDGRGGHHGVSNGCCITFPDASSLFFPKRTKLSSKRRFLSNS